MITINKTTLKGAVISASHSAIIVDKTLDGLTYGEELLSSSDGFTMTYKGRLIVKGYGINSINRSYPDMPEGAFAVIRGTNSENKEIAQPISKEAYDLLIDAINEARVEAEKNLKEVEKVEEGKMTVNPEYADMTASELKTAEKQYDYINNEGGEGYNPYRDNYYI